MNRLIFIIFILLPTLCISQEGGTRLMKIKSAKIVFLDLAGNGDKLVGVDNNGNSKGVIIDNSTLLLESNTLKVKNQYNTQTLSGTNITWNLSNGTDLFITLTGNTTINITNAVIGMTGTVWVTNAASAYTISFSGYLNSIDPYIRLSPNMVTTSGGGKSDDFTFKYNGVKMNWNGTLDRK